MVSCLFFFNIYPLLSLIYYCLCDLLSPYLYYLFFVYMYIIFTLYDRIILYYYYHYFVLCGIISLLYILITFIAILPYLIRLEVSILFLGRSLASPSSWRYTIHSSCVHRTSSTMTAVGAKFVPTIANKQIRDPGPADKQISR